MRHTFVYTNSKNITKKIEFFEHWIKIGDLSENGRNVTKKQAGNTMEILSINLLEKIWENECEKKPVFHIFCGVHGGVVNNFKFFCQSEEPGMCYIYS